MPDQFGITNLLINSDSSTDVINPFNQKQMDTGQGKYQYGPANLSQIVNKAMNDHRTAMYSDNKIDFYNSAKRTLNKPHEFRHLIQRKNK